MLEPKIDGWPGQGTADLIEYSYNMTGKSVWSQATGMAFNQPRLTVISTLSTQYMA